MKAVLFGATRGIGRSLARLMAARGDALVLLGRDPQALARSASDLAILGATQVATFLRDLSEPSISTRRSPPPTPRSTASTPWC